MSTPDPHTLPGAPGPALEALWGNLSPSQRTAIKPHLTGNTSADWISAQLRAECFQLSASSIRTYRRSLAQTGV